MLRFGTILLLFFASSVSLFAWSGLIASPGDILSIAKWNELVTLVNTKVSISDGTTATGSTWSSQKIEDSLVKVARIPLVSQTNLNASTTIYNTVELGTSTIDTIGVSVVANTITLPEGIYKFTLNTGLQGTATRASVGFSANVNGSLYSEIYGDYIRNNNGHNEMESVFSDVFELTGTGTLSFGGKRIAGSGTVTTNVAMSRVLIEKLQ